MTIAALVYPHQLYRRNPAILQSEIAVLVEEPLMFRQYAFHRQKLILHRASMQHYAEELRRSGLRVDYVHSAELRTTEGIADRLKQLGVSHVRCVDPCDDWLRQRLTEGLRTAGLPYEFLDDPNFLTARSIIEHHSAARKKFYFTDFYIEQRRRMRVLLTDQGGPVGGKWSFDVENRKKLPKGIAIPQVRPPAEDAFVLAARESIRRDFPDAPGEDHPFAYPTTHSAAQDWLQDFLEHRFGLFGDFEDAISSQETFLFHAVLTPMLNIGLLAPQQVVDAALTFQDRVPLNALEGFLRQVIGWREYMRLVYCAVGRQQRTRNFWGFERQLPSSFYDGSTGVAPVDRVIRRVWKHAYCHHIERLMILGNFMVLCEIHPDDVYRWFMEMFIDAYDWVMVPNVYGMSQHADGGRITTKPYISGSAYVLKMSDFKKGDWCAIWDALYWRFIDKHRAFFEKNPRMAVMTGQLDRLGARLDEHRRIADRFLTQLHRG